MDNREKIEEIRKKVSLNSIYINRVPQKAKVKFVKLAEEDFANDYGMTFKYQQEQCEEYQKFKELLLKGKNIEIKVTQKND